MLNSPAKAQSNSHLIGVYVNLETVKATAVPSVFTKVAIDLEAIMTDAVQ